MEDKKFATFVNQDEPETETPSEEETPSEGEAETPSEE
jgi:hypothetical protein